MLTKRKFISALIITLVVLLCIQVYSLYRDSRFSASAVVAPSGIGVYWDFNHTRTVSSISWGNMTPASTKNIRIYIRNESNESRTLAIAPTNWNPLAAKTQLKFTWKSTLNTLPPGAVANVTTTLNVPATVSGIQNFSFDIYISTSGPFPWDVTQDGRVDMRDIAAVTGAFTSTPGSPLWNPRADVNNDAMINMKDMALLVAHYGEYA